MHFAIFMLSSILTIVISCLLAYHLYLSSRSAASLPQLARSLELQRSQAGRLSQRKARSRAVMSDYELSLHAGAQLAAGETSKGLTLVSDGTCAWSLKAAVQGQRLSLILDFAFHRDSLMPTSDGVRVTVRVRLTAVAAGEVPKWLATNLWWIAVLVPLPPSMIYSKSRSK